MFWWGNLRQGKNCGDLGTDERILQWIFKKWDAGA